MEVKEIRRKIQSINNIRELTGALETLSAMKMKRAQSIAFSSRPFAQKIARILQKIEPVLKEKKLQFLREEKGNNILFLVLTSDRGFCGPFNQNVLRFGEKEIIGLGKEGKEVKVFPVGKKGSAFFKKRGYKTEFSFFGIGDFGELEDIKPISDFLIKSFLENRFQKICLVWMDFISTLIQKPRMIQLLPLKKENIKDFLQEETQEEYEDFLIEPSEELLGQEIIPHLVEYLVYQCILENNASEHSARMMAMRNASENAQKRCDQLKIDYNKARQEQITSEDCEISSTKEELE